jgi:hypothetical protein
MSSQKTSLRLDWANAAAARHACKHWHYSKSVPPGTAIVVGVWEDSRFIGVVIFSRGANSHMGQPYGLAQTECCELTRIALREHSTPVSRIVKVALMFLRKRSPGLRIVVSFADPNRDHHGGIYQAGGWIYTGCSAQGAAWRDKRGRIWHNRETSATGILVQFGERGRCPKRSECTRIVLEGKHRYLMPLDSEMQARLKPLAKPYPKRYKKECVGSAGSGTPGTQPGGGGAVPTSTLHRDKYDACAPLAHKSDDSD